MDSSLAMLQDTGLENLDMFRDQQILCDWMHDMVAMHPFVTPMEMQREAAPVPHLVMANGRRLVPAGAGQQVDAPHAPRRATDEEREYDAMWGGKASGFDISWAGVVGYTG